MWTTLKPACTKLNKSYEDKKCLTNNLYQTLVSLVSSPSPCLDSLYICGINKLQVIHSYNLAWLFLAVNPTITIRVFKFCEVKTQGGCNPMYWLYGYVPLERVYGFQAI